VPKVKGTKMTITCFGPVFIVLKMGFPILSSYQPHPNPPPSREGTLKEHYYSPSPGGRGLGGGGEKWDFLY